MKTVRRLIYTEVLSAVAFVTVAFLALFFFIDFIDELEKVGRNGYPAGTAVLYCLLQLPGRLYELVPIAVLIGTIYSMARLAQSSEFTVLRTSGLGPVSALGLLVQLALAFAAFTFVVGDYIAPVSDRHAEVVRAKARGNSSYGHTGAWLKDRLETPDGERSYSIQLTAATSDGELRDVRIYEFDPNGRLVSSVRAPSGHIEPGPLWRLQQARVSRWRPSAAPERVQGELEVIEQGPVTYEWRSSLSREVVAAAVQSPSQMSAVDLYRYANHLAGNEQSAQRYEIQFWRKALYPLACLVMVALALPFAYLHSRSGGISLKVFGGIMLGISFVLLNNVANHIGLLQDWTPWIAASVPSAVYLVLSLLAFNWLVRNR
ncbi:LPS export ABC transporter permease LptG [Aquabacterium sp. A7-Y]|uniref:LPS export ABC transporter permease LptG n=1 Tax=Aquabacterium sp. A7-Y TaxID=1349605 RepID=UPI00223E06CF|nr:LPS export ABC transporter permease LptG [Aquabacterium sp. A7-Y]MCW7537863.1 LPS export ABC transporter permease LptG [Aquabacterium sp. A7-Y]